MIAALLFTLFAQSQTPQRDARPAPAGVTGTITGIVVSAEAQPRPLRRTRVVLSGATERLPRSFVTGDDGTFRFERVPAGQFSVLAIKEGFITTDTAGAHPPRSSSGITVNAGQSVNVRIALPRGAVITGTVTDVDGLPAQGIAVSALGRRFVAGGAQAEFRYLATGVSAGPTDDRGVYRIYGLPQGEYIVAAQPQQRAVGLPGTEVRAMADGVVNPRPLVMSQVFHPGAAAVGAAARVSVRAGEERSGIDVPLQYVALATVSGTIAVPSGSNAPILTLTRTDDQPGFESGRTARVDADGKFAFTGVTPGQYRVMGTLTSAPAGPAGGARLFAWADVTVEGEDVTNIALTAQQGLSISGQIAFEGERGPAALPERIPMPLAMTIGTAGFVVPAVSVTGTRFSVQGIIPGTYRLAGSMRGIRTPLGSWWLKSLVVGGRDILDAPIDLRQNVDDAVVTFTDRASELSGVVSDPSGTPASAGWIIAFSPNRASWFFNSRRIAAVSPDREGRYTVRNLPPGEYRVIATRDVEQFEWFDPAVLERLLTAATPVTITGADKVTLNLKTR